MITTTEFEARDPRWTIALIGGLVAACAATLVVLVVFVGSSSETAAVATKVKPAIVEPIEGSERMRVTLTEPAVERIGVETAPIEDAQAVREGSSGTRAIAYGALLYEKDGGTFVYTNPEPLIFESAPVTVDYIEGDVVILSDGPPTGTKVVTVGGAELYGAETGVGK